MKIVLIGNIIGLLGSIAMVISTIIKEKKKIGNSSERGLPVVNKCRDISISKM